MPCQNSNDYRVAFARQAVTLVRRLTLWLSVIALTVMHPSVTANPSDRSKPINISADASEYDEKAGTQVLTGNVEISQGSMVINADRITVELRNNALYKITGSGNPIRFQQMTERKELMRGQSEEITYNTDTSEITFKGSAVFERPGQKFTGHSINYNIAQLTFKAEGNDKGRVSIVLQPGR